MRKKKNKHIEGQPTLKHDDDPTASGMSMNIRRNAGKQNIKHEYVPYGNWYESEEQTPGG
jgi:hypothetical protein